MLVSCCLHHRNLKGPGRRGTARESAPLAAKSLAGTEKTAPENERERKKKLKGVDHVCVVWDVGFKCEGGLSFLVQRATMHSPLDGLSLWVQCVMLD